MNAELVRTLNRAIAFTEKGDTFRARYAARELILMLQDKLGGLPDLYLIPTQATDRR